MPPDFSQASYWTTRFQSETAGFEWLAGWEQADSVLGASIDKAIARASASTNAKDKNKDKDRSESYVQRPGVSAPPQVLHIGCGSSRLSLWLRERIQDGRYIVNVDFAPLALQLGQLWERERWPLTEAPGSNLDGDIVKVSPGRKHNDNGVSDGSCTGMHWCVADLLSPMDIARLRLSTIAATTTRTTNTTVAADCFDVVIDKSTTDAVACGEDVLLSDEQLAEWPGLAVVTMMIKQASTKQEEPPASTAAAAKVAVRPELMLALNLASVTAPGATWIALSYSSDRFWWWRAVAAAAESSGSSASAQADAPAHAPAPAPFLEVFASSLWQLESREPVDAVDVDVAAATAAAATDGKSTIPPSPSPSPSPLPTSPVVYRPKVSNWLYTLRRTSAEFLPPSFSASASSSATAS